MNFYTLPTNFAQSVYGGEEYGSESYQQDSTTSTGGGGLSDTGMPVILGGTIGVSLLVCAVVLFTKARKGKNKK